MIQMHKVYIESLTPEVKKLYEQKDLEGLKAVLVEQCKVLETSTEFFPDLGKLLLTAGCLDSLKGGRACALLCDYVNF